VRANNGVVAGIQIEVKVTPRASRNEIVGMRDGVLTVRVTAAPVDDAANRALVKLLAKRAGVAPSRISIVRGERSRRKRVAIADATEEAVRALKE
jgi:uncharacterized protein (TIGR00251 family)